MYYPQSNGQNEAVNMISKQILKARLKDKNGIYPEEFFGILWSYNTTPRMTTGESPFTLTHGCKATVPVKVGSGSLKRNNYDP